MKANLQRTGANQDWYRAVETGKQHQRPEEGARPPFLRAKQRASTSKKQETKQDGDGWLWRRVEVMVVVGRSEANTARLCRQKVPKYKAQRYCNGTRPVLLRGLTTPPGITSRWREIQMLTEVPVYMKNRPLLWTASTQSHRYNHYSYNYTQVCIPNVWGRGETN